MVVCKKAYHKKYCAKNREQILARQKRYRTKNAEIFKSRVKGGMKTTGKGSPAAREPIVNKKNTSEITKNNTVKTTGKGSTNIGDLIMPRIRNRSSKDFVTKNKEK